MPSTRRRFLEISSAVGLVTVAGCLTHQTTAHSQAAGGKGTTRSKSDDGKTMSTHSSMNESQDTDGSERYNETDVRFLRMMIPHHKGAIAMAQLVPERTDRQALIELSQQIITTQRAEIKQMHMLLKEAGERLDEPMDTEKDMRSGTMNTQQMEKLRSLRGCEFDLMFIEMMIEHHRRAITMAKEVRKNGHSPTVEQLARNIIQAQRSEIEQMREWHQEWTTEHSPCKPSSHGVTKERD